MNKNISDLVIENAYITSLGVKSSDWIRIVILTLSFINSLIINPYNAYADQVLDNQLSSLAWELFNQNKNDQAVKTQYSLLESSRFKNSSEEIKLGILSDLILFEYDKVGIVKTIKDAIELEQIFKSLGLQHSATYNIHLGRLGFYYTLSENYEKADSMTRISVEYCNAGTFSLIQTLEVYSYRAGFLLSKADNLWSLHLGWETHDEIKKQCTKETRDIIAHGLKLAKSQDLQASIFYRYLVAMKERILIDEIRGAFISRDLIDNETRFSLYGNTNRSSSYLLCEYYNSILKNIQYGQIIESLKFLEPLAQVSVDCWGNNPTASKLYTLISDLYLRLYNIDKAEHYLQQAFNVDKHLELDSFKEPNFYIKKFEDIAIKSKEYEREKKLNPLYGFEKAILEQGSIRAKDARFPGVELIPALATFLPEGNTYDFDVLIEEYAHIYGNQSNLSKLNLQTFDNYHINPYINLTSSIIYGQDLDESYYYEDLRKYSQTLGEAKRQLLALIKHSNDTLQKSKLYNYLARYYFYMGNFEESIRAQQNSYNLIITSEGPFTDSALKSQKTLTLLYMLALWESIQNQNKKLVVKYQGAFVNLGTEYLTNIQKYIENHLFSLNDDEKKQLWQPISNWFYNTMLYMGINGSAAECMYNFALFNKGLLLSASLGKIPIHNWKEVRNELDENDMAIEFVNFRNIHGHEIYYAITINKGSIQPSIYPLFSDFEYKDLKIEDEQHYIDTRMNDLIFRPITIPETTKNIYFSPTGVINSFAIENIMDSLGKRASEKWNMYRVSSTREMINRNHNPNSDYANYTALIYGDLDYDCSLNKSDFDYLSSEHPTYSRFRGVTRARVSPLEFSRAEIDTIASMARKKNIDTYLFVGSEGTEESLKYYSRKNINILHLSTHGFYYSDEKISQDGLDSNQKYKFLFPEISLDSDELAMTRSALVLSGGNNIMRGLDIPLNREDGLLTAMEISNLSLNKCDLVSLSACETALGKVSHEGVFGLQRGLKKAGVHCILMSLWEVPDKATSILMQEFYSNLFNGKSKIEALRGAQVYLRNQPEYEEPTNWAGWILLDALN